MPNISHDSQETQLWLRRLEDQYNSEPPRSGVHISDLIVCLRRSPLMEDYKPRWDPMGILRMTLGRALEKTVFKMLIPHTTQEVEVIWEGVSEEDKIEPLEGHIDFGSDPYDYECKLSWMYRPTDPEVLLESRWYWIDQMAAYTFLRGRTAMKLVTLSTLPVPNLDCWLIEWEQDELFSFMESMLNKKRYVEKMKREGKYPGRTVHRKFCKGCPVEKICYKLEE